MRSLREAKQEMQFVNIDCLLAHIRKNHVDNAPRYLCPVCKTQFLTEQRLARHLLFSDPIQNPAQCGRDMPADEKAKASDSVLAYEIMELSVQELIWNNKVAVKQEIGTDDLTGNFNNKAPHVTAEATDKRASSLTDNRSLQSLIPPEPNFRNQEHQTTAPPKDMTMRTEIAAASQIPSISQQEMSPVKDEQTIQNQEHQRIPAPNNTAMETEIAAANQIPSTSRQVLIEDDEQNRAIQSLLSFSEFGDTDNWLDFDMTDTSGATIAAPLNEDIGFEPQDDSYLNLNPPLSDALVQQIQNNDNLVRESQNQANLQLNKENTPPPESTPAVGPSSAGNAFQMPKIVIAPAPNLQKTSKPSTSKKSILVENRPATNERSAEKKVRFISGDTLEKIGKKVAAKRKIDSDEESGSSSGSNSSNTSQESSSSSSSSPPRSPSPQFEPDIQPPFEPIIPMTFTRVQTARRGRKRANRVPARRGLNRSIQEPPAKYNTRLRVRERGDSISPGRWDDEKEENK
ncbi:hypothetical protein Ddc_13268 [Ditylenchus destructor]|nr:hypothetical protein Ddc_13268 [Ditylenchus destructor]